MTDSTKPGAGAVVTRYGLLKLHDELVDALDLDGAPRECDPLLETLNDAYNLGQRSRDAEVERLQRELADSDAANERLAREIELWELVAIRRLDVSPHLEGAAVRDAAEDAITAALARGGK